ncbi:MAG: glycosyltransferase family 2 protein [Chlorobiaceae bacterium]|nr:glycosyltransferase family 2 protein [Chlorobiaceae bacterium]
MKTPKTCIVVLNWNGARDTVACLGSIFRANDLSTVVLVVDNGSSDGSPDMILEAFPGTEMLRLPSNLGYAAGNNAGFRRAEEMQAGYVVFLNNDTLVEGNFSLPLVDLLENNTDAGIAVPKICYLGNPRKIWYAGGQVRLLTGLVRHVGIRREDGPEYCRPGTTDYATGCCIAMRCGDFRRAGGFDEGFGMYAEDVDLSLRVRAMGLNIRYVPSSKVLHRVSASLGGKRLKKLRRQSAGLFRLFLKHRAWSAFMLYPLLLPFRLAVSAFFHVDAKERVSGRESI